MNRSSEPRNPGESPSDLTEFKECKEQAIKLIDRIWQSARLEPGAGKDLARSAIEVALRDAYIRGKAAAISFGGESPPSAKARPKAAFSEPETGTSLQCSHHWKESFQDGRTVEIRCTHCGVAQREVQEKCDHYFVPVGSDEVCVACRKARHPRKRS